MQGGECASAAAAGSPHALASHQLHHVGVVPEATERKKIEADVLSNVVLINGIPLHPQTGKENRMESSVETIQRTHEFLSSISINTSLCGITWATKTRSWEVGISCNPAYRGLTLRWNHS